jgi:hypothetical protein
VEAVKESISAESSALEKSYWFKSKKVIGDEDTSDFARALELSPWQEALIRIS